MKNANFIVTIGIALAFMAVGPLAPASARPAPSQPASAQPATPFETEVAAAKAAMMGNPELALTHARTAAALSRRNPDETARQIGEATGYWLEGEALVRVNRPEEARPVLERGMAIVARYGANTKLHADLLKARAALSLVTGQVQPALADLLAAHSMFQALHEPRSQAIVLQNLGSIYLEARDFERALRYYEQANETYSDDPALTLAAHNNRGNALKELGRYADAEREFALALEAARAIDSDLLEARILSNLASTLALAGQPRPRRRDRPARPADFAALGGGLGAVPVGRTRPDRPQPRRPPDRAPLCRADLRRRRSRRIDHALSRVPRHRPAGLFPPRRRPDRLPPLHRFQASQRRGPQHRRLDQRRPDDRALRRHQPESAHRPAEGRAAPARSGAHHRAAEPGASQADRPDRRCSPRSPSSPSALSPSAPSSAAATRSPRPTSS